MIPLNPAGDLVELTRALVDVPSESGDEAALADAVESALRACAHLTVERIGNSVVARTDPARTAPGRFGSGRTDPGRTDPAPTDPGRTVSGCVDSGRVGSGRTERVVVAGHLDTVPAAGNLPSRLDGDLLHGLGACDMKGGVAVALRLAATLTAPVRDVTYVFYECEELSGDRNGLNRIAAERPDLLEADLAILMEPSDAGVEAGCQGVLNADITVRGERAHTARSWRGVNAAHRAAAVLRRLDEHTAERIVIDGLEYREGLNAVAVRAGVAENVVPDTCVITVNLRFAPSRSAGQAEAYLRGLFPEYEVEVTEVVPGALPGLRQGPVAALVEVLGATPRPKLGWTDVARFAALGTPALNYGPGDPALAHTAGEYVPVGQLRECEARLAAWLTGRAAEPPTGRAGEPLDR